MKKVIPLFLVFLAFHSAQGAFPVDREIRDSEGQRVRGTILKLTDEQIYFERQADGALFWVPLNRLSVEDQSWLETHLASSSRRVRNGGACVA